jgi:uncharacterized protein (DUF1800 family)
MLFDLSVKQSNSVYGENMRNPAKLPGIYKYLISLGLAFGMFAGNLPVAAVPATATDKNQRLGEDQKIVHVLNRLGFGVRPGDVERVRQMGVQKYIELQLQPERIPDTVAESKVRDFSSLSMTTAELYEKYPQPGQLLRALQRRNDLPPDLAAAVKDRVKGAGLPGASPAEMAGPEMKKDQAASDPGMAKANDALAGGKNDEYRKALRDYYIQNNLRLPQAMTQELVASRILRAVYSERQLQEEMLDFWSNHFNIFAGKGADRWLLISYDRDTIRPNTMGKFGDLLKATAESPAMLFYLDNFQSVSPNASAGAGRYNGQGAGADLLRSLGQNRRMQRVGNGQTAMRPGQLPENQAQMLRPNQNKQPKRGINENYARELMELHTLGVDGGYTQKDVQEVARCFTGWTIFAPRGAMARAGMGPQGGRLVQEMAGQAGKFYFNARLHDDGEKTVLGHKIPAGGGVKDGYMVLDILAHHPSTAKFISTKLARNFVMDNPTPELVNRISAVYLKSDGDIRETLRAIFNSPQFNSALAYRAKIKTPFELAVSAIRSLGGETNGGPGINQWIARMGQPMYGYQAPTGYPDSAENWVNTGSLLERLNFGLALASNRIPGTRVDLQKFSGDSGGEISAERKRIMNRFLDVIVQGEISDATRATLLKQLDQPLPVTAMASSSSDSDRESTQAGGRGGRRSQREVAINTVPVRNPEVVKIVGLILGSPEFQRQ